MVRNEELMNLAFTAMEATDLLVDERFKTPRAMYQHREAVGQRIQEIIASKSSDDWLEIFNEFDVPINRIGIVEETPTDPQIHLNRMVTKTEDPTIGVPLVVNHPVQVTGVDHVPMKLAPQLGQHSREVLNELGYDHAEIEAFLTDGVVVEPESSESD